MLPALALSVRQPWAWAIVHGFKDVENRSKAAVKWMVPLRGTRAIHAAKGMTRDEYELARDYMVERGVECPPPADLQRGGIVGVADVIDAVDRSDSDWFCGPLGLVLRNARPHPFVRATGQLGYFSWSPDEHSTDPEPPAKWMLASSALETPVRRAAIVKPDTRQLDLIDLVHSAAS